VQTCVHFSFENLYRELKLSLEPTIELKLESNSVKKTGMEMEINYLYTLEQACGTEISLDCIVSTVLGIHSEPQNGATFIFTIMLANVDQF